MNNMLELMFNYKKKKNLFLRFKLNIISFDIHTFYSCYIL